MVDSKTEEYVSSSTSTFLVGRMEEKITENNFLLSQSSKVFEAMLCGELKEKCNIKVPDIEPDAFRTMLKFLNGKRIGFLNMDHAMKVCYAADKYDLPDLKEECAEYIFPTSTDDVYVALNCGVLYDIDFLKEAAMKLVRQNTYKVLTSIQFLTLSRLALKMIVQEDCLDVNSEIELFEAVLYWAKYQCADAGISSKPKNLREMLGDVLNHIRFLTMDKFDIMKYGKMILPADEIKLLLKYVNEEIDTLLEHLCLIPVRRKKVEQQLPIVAALYTLRFCDRQEKQIVKSHNIKSQPLLQSFGYPIALHSITIPTRSSFHEDCYRYYFEKVVVDLRKSNGDIIASGSYVGKAEYDSEMRIQLSTPDGTFPKISSYVSSSNRYNTTSTSSYTYILEVSFKSQNIYYYPLRMCNFQSVFANMTNTISYVIGMEYSK